MKEVIPLVMGHFAPKKRHRMMLAAVLAVACGLGIFVAVLRGSEPRGRAVLRNTQASHGLQHSTAVGPYHSHPHGLPAAESRGEGHRAGSGVKRHVRALFVTSEEARAIRRSRALLADGSIVEAAPGRTIQSGTVLAELYDGAPPGAVERLRQVLLTGSNEHAEFTKTERYPEWAYEKMKEMVPGQLGEVLAWLAEQAAEMDPKERPMPVQAWGDGKEYRVLRIGPAGEVPVAETRFGTAWVFKQYGDVNPFDLAVWMAHRISAGDRDLELPRLPPEGYDSWDSWMRGWVGVSLIQRMEGVGLLPPGGG